MSMALGSDLISSPAPCLLISSLTSLSHSLLPIMAPVTLTAPLITSPGTKAAKGKAKKAVIIAVAHDVIIWHNESESAYGILPKVLAQYKTFDITRWQLQHAMRKIDGVFQLPSELFPSIVSCPANLSLPMSMITGDSTSNITTATMSTSNIMTATMSTLTGESNNTIAAMMMAPRSKGGRPKGSATKLRALKTKQMKDIIEEASQQILNAQQKKGKLNVG